MSTKLDMKKTHAILILYVLLINGNFIFALYKFHSLCKLNEDVYNANGIR